MRAALLALAMLTAPPAFAQWNENGEVAPADASRAEQDGFAVMMMVTPDSAQFLEAWAGPTPPHLVTTDEAIRNKPVEAMLLFTGCKPDSAGACRVTADFVITGPDGSVYGENRDAAVWSGAPPPERNLQLAESGLGLIIDPEDALGSYRIEATVTDHVAGISLPVTAEVTAVEAAD